MSTMVGRELNRGQVKMAEMMPETVLQAHVTKACKDLGVKHWHHRISKGTQAGWLDSFMIGPAGILVYELKVQSPSKGKVSGPQQECLDALRANGIAAYVRRPSDWISGLITEEILAISGRRKAF